MVTDRVVRELHAALASLRGEREQLDKQISAMESALAQMGAPVKRGPGRPKGSGVKRGPGRPPKAETLLAAVAAPEAPVKRGPGRPKGSKNKKRGPGRPPKSESASASSSSDAPVKTRRAPKWSPAAREAARQRMQAYWAERKRKASGS